MLSKINETANLPTQRAAYWDKRQQNLPLRSKLHIYIFFVYPDVCAVQHPLPAPAEPVTCTEHPSHYTGLMPPRFNYKRYKLWKIPDFYSNENINHGLLFKLNKYIK